jgi:arylsulfatase A-like enzyme
VGTPIEAAGLNHMHRLRDEGKRRSFVALAIAVASLAATHDFTAEPAQSRRPDVIVVLTDQQRADAFGAAGATDLHTPVMDRLARQGVLFTRAFTATPQCSPSRAALLTGRYPHRTGVMGNTAGEGRGGAAAGSPPAGMSPALDRSIPTLGRIFGAAGYETAYFGKWHLGGTPGDYGFESHDSTFDDSTLARRVVGFVRKRPVDEGRRPFLLVVSWLDPHDIYNVFTAAPPDARALTAARLPSNLIDNLQYKPFPQRHYLEEDQGKPFAGAGVEVWRRYRAFYNGLVETVDREIGTVLDAFAGGDVPPITIFTTDHGDLGGAHGLPYKGPAMYEELVRVPLVISWPGRIRAARSDALVSLIDLLPTLCDLTRAPLPDGVDGLSLRPVLEQTMPGGREMVFAEYYGKQAWRVPIRMVRTARWKYVRYLGYGEELYDLAADPGELRNLAREERGKSERARLARELDDWIRRTGDPFPTLTTTDRSGKVVPASGFKTREVRLKPDATFGLETGSTDQTK